MTQTALFEDLQQRGLVAQTTQNSEFFSRYLRDEALTVYCGFDPTADSLHIGHLVPLMMLKRFQMAGHTPVALIGGATGMIGDPSFKATERSLNSSDTVMQWASKLGDQIQHFLTPVAGKSAPKLVNNADWMQSFSVLDFLRDIGKYFSVNAMINKESVKQRINREDQGISFTEFSYALLQSYDFAVLNREYGCTLQIGGSDQWGNITSGIDLTRRLNSQQVHGMTVPLITKSDGTKFGKTESGTVWLDAQKTSPYAFYQFWLNTADADVYRFLKYYTFLSVEEINQLEAKDAVAATKPSASYVLAEQMTLLVHGEAALKAAKQTSERLFNRDFDALSEVEFTDICQSGMHNIQAEAPLSVCDALVALNLAKSRRAARELIESSAIRLSTSLSNGLVSDSESLIHPSDAYHGRFAVLQKGKKSFGVIRF
jgi:tyrosyl-tRNA synthetase